MKFQGAVVHEQGVTFGIVVVKPSVLSNPSVREAMQEFGIEAFGFMPIVLMAQNTRGVPTYWGRKDIVNFLSRVPMQCIPWQEYMVAA